MLHPRLTPKGATIGGSSSMFLAQIGPYGAWSGLNVSTRWGEGSAGMYEAQWTMPLPADFDHYLLRHDTIVELMDGPWRVGSPLVLAEPSRGTGLDNPWQFVASGFGRMVEGENSWAAVDGSGNGTSVASTAVDQAITNRSLPWAGRDSSIPTSAYGGSSSTDLLNSLGSLLSAASDAQGKRWLVDNDNIVKFRSDPTTPSYQITPGAAALGTADDDYATVVLFRFKDSGTSLYTTVAAPSTQSAVEGTFGRREYIVDFTQQLPISSATATSYANGILAKSKGRLAWTNGLTVTSNDILTMGGAPADLSKVLDDVASGCMVRIHGVWLDLLAFAGATYIDVVIGEAKYADEAQTIDLSPLGLAKRDLAGIVEEITGAALS